MTVSLNQRAWTLVDRMVTDADVLRIRVETLPNGTRLIDCGVNAPGSLEAGRRFAEICMGGLGTVTFTQGALGGTWWPAVLVFTDHPAEACLAAQYAGWAIRRGEYFAMGSGPARALIRAEKELYEALGYEEQSDVAVLCLETRALPSSDVADYIAERAGVSSSALTLLVAPTASPVGGIQIAARVIETTLHKLHTLGFDVRRVISGFGTCPLPPTAKSDHRAIGRTNDAVLYGGQVHLTVQTDDAELESVVQRLPSSTSPDYGAPFYEILKRFHFDFYRIDPLLFSPAEVFITNVRTGRTFHAGEVNASVLRQSFFS